MDGESNHVVRVILLEFLCVCSVQVFLCKVARIMRVGSYEIVKICAFAIRRLEAASL